MFELCEEDFTEFHLSKKLEHTHTYCLFLGYIQDDSLLFMKEHGRQISYTKETAMYRKFGYRDLPMLRLFPTDDSLTKTMFFECFSCTLSDFHFISHEELFKNTVEILKNLMSLHSFGIRHMNLNNQNIVYVDGSWKFRNFEESIILSDNDYPPDTTSNDVLQIGKVLLTLINRLGDIPKDDKVNVDVTKMRAAVNKCMLGPTQRPTIENLYTIWTSSDM